MKRDGKTGRDTERQGKTQRNQERDRKTERDRERQRQIKRNASRKDWLISGMDSLSQQRGAWSRRRRI